MIRYPDNLEADMLFTAEEMDWAIDRPPCRQISRRPEK